MICCQSASQTVNLYYSAIKFLSFKGIVWVGDSLPLQLNSLGELMQIQVDLRDQAGEKIKGSLQMGQLSAPFEKGKVYDLSMRLEYMLPIEVSSYASDFASIHPTSYTVSLDFAVGNLYGREHYAQVELGDQSHRFKVPQNLERTLEAGCQLKIFHERDYCSLMVTASKDAPFSHRYFPVLSVRSEV